MDEEELMKNKSTAASHPRRRELNARRIDLCEGSDEGSIRVRAALHPTHVHNARSHGSSHMPHRKQTGKGDMRGWHHLGWTRPKKPQLREGRRRERMRTWRAAAELAPQGACGGSRPSCHGEGGRSGFGILGWGERGEGGIAWWRVVRE